MPATSLSFIAAKRRTKGRRRRGGRPARGRRRGCGRRRGEAGESPSIHSSRPGQRVLEIAAGTVSRSTSSPAAFASSSSRRATSRLSRWWAPGKGRMPSYEPRRCPHVDELAAHEDARPAVRLDQTRPGRPCLRADRAEGLGRERAHDGGTPAAHDARLLPRDRGERPPQVDLVIEVDADDRGRDRIGHVRGVETRAEADLEHRHVDALATEVHEGGGGEGLEERGVGGEGAAAHESLGGGAHASARAISKS